MEKNYGQKRRKSTISKIDIRGMCLEYLIGKGDVEQAADIIRQLKDKGFVSMDIRDRLLNKIKDRESISQAVLDMEGVDHRWKKRNSPDSGIRAKSEKLLGKP